MLGCWRFLLAVMVLVGHGYLPASRYFGIYAVECFYILSGYLITLVLNEKYRGARGRIAFVKNRFLRIYPTYWVCLLITIVFGFLTGWTIRADAPNSTLAWVRELSVVGIKLNNGPHFIGQSWTLWIELVFYGLMAVGASANQWLACVWLVISAAIHAWFLHIHAYWWEHAYISWPGNSLPFAMGAAAYWVAKWSWPNWCAAVAIIAMLLHACLVNRIYGDPYITGFYVNLILGGIVVGTSGRITARHWRWLAHVDRILGDVTYPLYLIHISALQMASTILGSGQVEQKTLAGSGTGLAIALPVSLLIWWLVDRPIARMRNRVRVESAVTETTRD